MAIEFACPNGHKLSSPDESAGRMAKCPRCGVITRVPLPEENGQPQHTAPQTPAADPSGSGKQSANSAPAADQENVGAANGDTPTADASAGDKPAAEEQIVFLCPNGHKLNAPQSLQGRGGQCPHCGAKFRIPLLDEADADVGGDETAGTATEEFALYDEAGETGDAFELGATEIPDISEEIEPIEIDQHPLARLVTRLWSEREHGGIVELHLTGGAMLVPEWFEKRLSQQSHGLFATQAADGTVTMMIVPWESVLRVVVRGVVGLPDGMFE